MITLKKILFIILCFCLLNTQAYGFAKIMEPPDELCLEINIEKDYGINIIIVEEDEYLDYKECLLVLERSLRKFPEGVIKEITDYYAINGISTNVIINRTEKIMDLFSEYIIDDKSANVYMNALQSSLYSDYRVASEDSLAHELGHFVADYIFEIYGYEKIEAHFENYNEGYTYGQWEDDYSNVFINKHSAISFKDEVADLIWYSEVHPEALRNINGGENGIVHEKVGFLAGVFDQCFNSITEDSKLWMEAVPQKPDEWAADSIAVMKSALLIPLEFEGIYNAYITRENFYALALKVIERKFGEEKFYRYFNINMQEEYVIIDPVKGEIFIDDGMSNAFTDVLLCSNKELIYQTYQMGLINHEIMELPPDGYMTRLEIAKLFKYMGNQLGMDISDYKAVYYDDIYKVKESDRPFIYFAASKGLIKGYGTNFKPYDYCTYQEAYIMLLRLYNML